MTVKPRWELATLAVRRISELLGVLEQRGIHAPGNCWCGEHHEREASNTGTRQDDA